MLHGKKGVSFNAFESYVFIKNILEKIVVNQERRRKLIQKLFHASLR